MSNSCYDGSFNHGWLETEDGVSDYGNHMVETFVCKYWESCDEISLCICITPSYDLGSRNDPMTTRTPFSEAKVYFLCLLGCRSEDGNTFEGGLWRMNRWRRGWPKAPPAPMIRIEVDMIKMN